MKFYFSKGACSLSIRILLNELGMTFDAVSVNLKTKQTESGEDYFKINPKGAVPAITMKDGSVLTENTAIHQYLAELADATRLLPETGNAKRYRVLEWLSYVSSDLHKSFGPFFNPEIPEATREIVRPILLKKFKFVDQHLKTNTYLMGDEYSLPDGYLFVISRWLPVTKVDTAELPNLMRFMETMKARNAVQKSLQEEGLN